jgi:hypothetical protein
MNLEEVGYGFLVVLTIACYGALIYYWTKDILDFIKRKRGIS